MTGKQAVTAKEYKYEVWRGRATWEVATRVANRMNNHFGLTNVKCSLHAARAWDDDEAYILATSPAMIRESELHDLTMMIQGAIVMAR